MFGFSFRDFRLARRVKSVIEDSKKAALRGDANAQFLIGGIYWCGTDVPQDYKEAVRWYHMAAVQGHTEATEFLLSVYRELGEANQNDVKWLEKASADGDAAAQVRLGEMYVSGESVEKDETKAFELHQKAAEQGFAEGQLCLGIKYHSGIGVPKNKAKAVEWYRKAEAQGNFMASHFLEILKKGNKEAEN